MAEDQRKTVASTQVVDSEETRSPTADDPQQTGGTLGRQATRFALSPDDLLVSSISSGSQKGVGAVQRSQSNLGMTGTTSQLPKGSAQQLRQLESSVAQIKTDLSVHKGDYEEFKADLHMKLQEHADNHEQARDKVQQFEEFQDEVQRKHREFQSIVEEGTDKSRLLVEKARDDLSAKIQEQTHFIILQQEKFEDELRQKLDKSLGPLRQMQDLLYKLASVEERMDTLEAQFRERLNTLYSMHEARLDRVEGRGGVVPPPAAVESKVDAEQHFAVFGQHLQDHANRLAIAENKLQEMECTTRLSDSAPPNSHSWHLVAKEGYSPLDMPELTRLTNAVQEDLNEDLGEPLPHDSWGASVILICKELPDLCNREGDCVSCVLMMALPFICSMTLFLQCVLVLLLSSYVIAPAVEDLQLSHQTYCSDKSGKFEAPITSAWFTCVSLWLWMMAVIVEVRKCFALLTVLYACPRVGQTREMAQISFLDIERKEEDAHGDLHGIRIVGMTALARCTILVTIILPRLVVVMYLGWMGSQWLATSMHYSDLLLATLVLQLILNIDNAVYKSCLPDSYRAKVQKSTILRGSSADEVAATSRSRMLGTMLLTFLLVLLCLAFIFVFYFVFQHDSWSCSPTPEIAENRRLYEAFL